MSAKRVVARALAVAVAVSTPILLLAHMALEKSVPENGATLSAPPRTVQLFFSEAPDPAVSRLELHGPAKDARLVAGHVMGKSLMATVEGELPDGAYTVMWQGAGDDGHVLKGEITFTLKRQ
jgi:methionine-rich copper-binding protein CopC